MGRKGKYETHVKPFLPQIAEWFELLSESQIAGKLGISVASFENYKKAYPELRECMKRSKEHLAEELKKNLKKKAQGFYYEESRTYVKREGGKTVKITETFKKYAQPDTGAIHLLLKNIDDEWRNDDRASYDMKREKIELEKQKAENDW